MLTLLFYNFRDHDEARSWLEHPFSVSWRDASRAVRCALEVEVGTLPSRCEIFYILTDLPHGKFRNDKTMRLLGWKPQDGPREIHER